MMVNQSPVGRMDAKSLHYGSLAKLWQSSALPVTRHNPGDIIFPLTNYCALMVESGSNSTDCCIARSSPVDR